MNDLTPGIGHNSPPLYDEGAFEALRERTVALAESGGAWLDLGTIETEDSAQKLVDALAQVKKQVKTIDAARTAAKKPHLDASAAVDRAFKTLAEPMTKLADRMAAMLTGYQREKQARLDAERREREAVERARAEEARRAAEEAAKRNDVMGQAAAEEAAKEAERAAKEAARPQSAAVQSASGGARTASLRTYYTPQFDTNLPPDVARAKAVRWLAGQDEFAEKLDTAILTLIEAARRGGVEPANIPGVIFIVEQRAV